MIIKITIPGMDNDLAVVAKRVGAFAIVQPSQMNLVDSVPGYWLPHWVHQRNFIEVKPILFTFTMSAKSQVPCLKLNHTVKAIEVDTGYYGTYYDVSYTEMKAAGLTKEYLDTKCNSGGNFYISQRYTLPVKYKA
jgi:hypothetical protein